MPKAKAIGIDLGTSSSCVGIFQNGKVEIIKNDYGDFTTSSFVAFTDTERFVGERAKNQMAANLNNTIFHAHRLLGHKIYDPIVQSDMHLWPFNIISDENGNLKFLLQYKNEVKDFTPEKILSLILKYIKKQAETYIGEFVKAVVISIPACYNYLQRQAIKDAANIAGLNVLSLISTPNAAAIAYSFDKKKSGEDEKNVLIFDLGGGTLGVSILTIGSGICAVESVAGNSHLGGEDFDYQMVDHFVAEFKSKHKKDIYSNPHVLCRLKSACENAKFTLTNSNQAIIKFSKPRAKNGKHKKSIDFSTSISREKFDELCADQLQHIMDTVKKVLQDAKMDKDEIDEIILIGGSSRIPKIQTSLSEFFNGKSLNTNFKTDEAGAYGAAIQAAILSGDKHANIRNLSLLDVTPFSFGIETVGGVFSRIIKRNSRLPSKNSQTFTTFTDNQTEMTIKVFQGENPNSKDNLLFAKFKFYGIPPAPRGVPQIKVTFNVDMDHVLTVSIQDKLTGLKKVISITKNNLFNNVENKNENAETNEILPAKQQLLNFCYNIKQCLEDIQKDKNSDEHLKKVGKKCDETLLWISKNQNCSKKEYSDILFLLQKDIQVIWNPIITRFYESVGFNKFLICKQIKS